MNQWLSAGQYTQITQALRLFTDLYFQNAALLELLAQSEIKQQHLLPAMEHLLQARLYVVTPQDQQRLDETISRVANKLLIRYKSEGNYSAQLALLESTVCFQ